MVSKMLNIAFLLCLNLYSTLPTPLWGWTLAQLHYFTVCSGVGSSQSPVCFRSIYSPAHNYDVTHMKQGQTDLWVVCGAAKMKCG